jgi:hypothetical protein
VCSVYFGKSTGCKVCLCVFCDRLSSGQTVGCVCACVCVGVFECVCSVIQRCLLYRQDFYII